MNKVEVIFEIDKDAQGRTVLRQIDSGLDKIGNTAQGTGKQVDAGLALFKGTLIAEFFRRGISAALNFEKQAVQAFNESKNAALGLTSVAAFRGISGDSANEAVRDLHIVRDGLISIGDASTALKNLLASGFGLEQSITLIERIGDSAAFGRQAALSFGDAVRSATEGIKNQNSILVDNAGITKNISKILDERGFKMQDLDDKVKGAAAREALYQGILAETQAQVGDAAKLAGEFGGQVARLDAEQRKLLETIGEIIVKNPDFGAGFKDLVGVIAELSKEIGTEGTGANSAIKALATATGEGAKSINNMVESGRELLDLLKRIGDSPVARLINITPLGNLINALGIPKRRAAEAKLEQQRQLQAEINGLVKPPQIFLSEIDEETRKNAAAALAKTERQIAEAVAEANKEREKAKKIIEETSSVFTSLKAQLEVSPYIKLYDAAEQRQTDFLKRFKDVPEQIRREFEKLNEDVLGLAIFKENLAASDRLNNLTFEQERLRAGLAGQTIRDETEQFEREREAIRREIRERRDAGTLDAKTHAELISKLGNIGIKSKSDEIAAQLLERQINSAQEALAKADTLAKESLALERLVTLTSDIGKLNPQQADIRMKALERQLAIESEVQAERQAREDELAQAQSELASATKELVVELKKLNGSGLSGDKPPATVIVKVEGETSGVSVSRERLGLTTFHRGGGLYEEY